MSKYLNVNPQPIKIFEYIKNEFIKQGKFVVLNN